MEVEFPDGPASPGDRMAESALLEIAITSRRVSAKVSSSTGAGSGPCLPVPSESTARAFPFPLSVPLSFAGAGLGRSFGVSRAEERMVGTSWKSGPSIQGICWPPELSVESRINDKNEET